MKQLTIIFLLLFSGNQLLHKEQEDPYPNQKNGNTDLQSRLVLLSWPFIFPRDASKEKQHPEYEPPSWYLRSGIWLWKWQSALFEADPNWALFLVGIGGIFIAIRTLNTIEEQTKQIAISAKATEKSVNLQEVGMRQWVILDEGKVKHAHYQPNATGTTLTVSFNIVNPTNIPLRLRTVAVEAARQKRGFIMGQVLAPNDDPAEISFSIILNPEQFAAYKANRLTFPIEMTVFFEDAFDKKRHQSLGYVCKCGYSLVTEFTPYGFTPRPMSEREARGQDPPKKAT